MNNQVISQEGPGFTSLCHEHLDAIVFTKQLREGLRKGIDIERLANYTRWFWKHHIKLHFSQEEKILLPAISGIHPLAIKLRHDHEEIREILINIDRDTDRYDLSSLCNIIEAHIKWEESTFFPYLEQHLEKEKWATIIQELANAPTPEKINCEKEYQKSLE